MEHHMSLTIRNTRDLLDDPKIKEPWPEQFVDWYTRRDTKVADELATVLNEAKDERPLQEFYTKHPYMLALAFSVHCCWMFPKPRLGGGKWVPDFLLCDKNSLGYQWTLIELESPRMEATNKDESVSADCNHALQQIRDYRRWLRDNALFEEKQGFKGLNADCEGWVVIGRRDADRRELEQQRLADFRKERIEVASYDRLLYLARDHLQVVNGDWEKAEKAAEKVAEINADKHETQN
jgi:hypothetical protein